MDAEKISPEYSGSAAGSAGSPRPADTGSGSAGEPFSMDPVHPDLLRPDVNADAAAALAAEFRRARSAEERPAHRRRTQLAERRPRATDLGFPAVLEHEVVGIEIGAAPRPIIVHRWVDGRPRAFPMRPLHAVVWARAGRVTLIGDDDVTHRLTLLAPDEHGAHRIGEHWPLNEPENRAKRVAAATLRDVGEVLIFPVWLARTAHLSAERNAMTKRFLRDLAAASPDTVIQHNQTFGTPAPTPGQVPPFEHRGLLGHEGYPKEMAMDERMRAGEKED
ncbi:MAG TPA: hypothetical protein VGX23_25030 [Actinocrinis sp.]|nr:hypothetical protein [Actinocrinis sp.]